MAVLFPSQCLVGRSLYELMLVGRSLYELMLVRRSLYELMLVGRSLYELMLVGCFPLRVNAGWFVLFTSQCWLVVLFTS